MTNKLLKKGSMLFALTMFLTLSQTMSAQYCVPEGTNDSRYIDNFSTTGGSENISNLGSGFSTDGYGDFTTMTVKQVQANDVDFSVNIEGGTAGFRIWVDWNQDGVFDATEEVAYNSTGYIASHEGSFTVPTDATPGETRMRIVSHWLSQTGDVDPCETGFTYGEFEDYTFDVVALQACTEAIAGTVVGDTEMEVCANVSFSMSVTGNSEPATGLTRTWQSSPVGEGDWTDLNVSSPTYNVPGIDTATDFRYHVECVNGDSDDSEVISVSINPNTDECYCEPVGTNADRYINNFSTTGGIENISNLESGFSPAGYGDFTAMTLEANPGDELSFTADVEGGTAGFRIWIDWNNDGSFDTTEEVAYQSGSYEDTHTGSFTVPVDAEGVTTRMRIVSSYIGSSGDVDPCNTDYTYGEFEDYTISVAGGGGGTFPSPYCDITDADQVIVEEITKVDFADTVITNDDGDSVLIDKTDIVVNVTAGETYTLSVEGFTNGDFETNIVAFIDWNQNEILNDAGEVYELGTIENSTGDDGVSVTMEILVPADAVLGETRIRITKTYFDDVSDAIVNPCGIEFDPFGMGIYPGYGQALDFTLNIEEGLGGSYCEGEGVDFNEDGGIVNFSTTDGITNVDNQGIEDPTGYHNFTDMVITQAAGESFTFTADIDENGFGDAGVAIYIDYNKDFEFGLDLPERAFTTSTDGFVTTVTATLTIPADTDPGNYRFRITSDNMTSGPSPCEPLGSIHDYTLTVTEGDGGEEVACSEENPNDGTFENGFNISNTTAFKTANDLTVAADEDFTLTNITASIFANEGITNVDVIYYNDASGVPGAVIGSQDSVTIDNQAVIGENFGFDVNEVEMSVDPFVFSGRDGIETTYWIELSATDGGGTGNVFWVVTSSSMNGNPTAQFDGGWTLDEDGMDGVYIWEGLCGPRDPGVDCEGTPDGGVAAVNPETGGPESTYSVSASGFTTGNGLTYQWQSNTDGAGWESEGDLESYYSAFTATAPTEIGIDVEWRLEVTCTLSAESAFSEVATFTTVLAYCDADSDIVEPITRVIFAGIDNESSATSSDGYEDFTDIMAEVAAGGTYSFAAEGTTSGDYPNHFTVWIDWNNNGEFESDEMTTIGSIENSDGTDGQQAVNDITVPTDAVQGETRMRVRKNYNSPYTDPCGNNTFGQVEDYTVNIDGVVGVDDHSATDFTYYPNPMDEVLYITAQNDIESVSAYNVLGQHVLSNKNFADGKVDVSSLPAGTYLFRVTFEGGQAENFTVLKK